MPYCLVTNLQISCLQNGFLLPWIWSCEKNTTFVYKFELWAIKVMRWNMKNSVEVRIFTNLIWQMAGILSKWTVRVVFRSLKLNRKVFFFYGKVEIFFLQNGVAFLLQSFTRIIYRSLNCSFTPVWRHMFTYINGQKHTKWHLDEYFMARHITWSVKLPSQVSKIASAIQGWSLMIYHSITYPRLSCYDKISSEITQNSRLAA